MCDHTQATADVYVSCGHLGNAVKYISRAGKKSTGTTLDLKKSRWYLDRQIANMERDAAKPVARKGIMR